MYPNHFYYHDKTSSKKYTYEAQGSLSVEHLIKNQACWEKINYSNQRKKKTLILADFTLHLDKIHVVEEKFQKLKKLYQEGFSIYFLSKKKELTLLNDNNSMQLKYKTLFSLTRNLIDPDNMFLTSPENILKQAASQLSLAKDEILILDDYQLNNIENLHPSKPRQFNYESIIHYNNIISQKISQENRIVSLDQLAPIITVLQQASPPIELLYHKEFSFKNDNIVREILQCLPNASIKNDYEKVTLRQEELNILLKEKKLKLAAQTLDINQLSTIKHLNLSQCIPTLSQLQEILTQTKDMEQLTILLTKEGIPNLGSLPHLTTLEIGGEVSAKNLRILLDSLFAKSSHLNKLIINNCQVRGELDLPTCIHTVVLNKTNIAGEQIKKIIQSSSEVVFYLTGEQIKTIIKSSSDKEFNKKLVSANSSGTGSIICTTIEDLDIPDKPLSLNLSPPLKYNDSASITLDADTSNSSVTFNPQRIFYPINDTMSTPHVNTYRLHLYNDLSVNSNYCKQEEAFFLKKKGDLNITKTNCQHTEDLISVAKNLSSTKDLIFYGRQSLLLTENWQPLASLSPNEDLTHYHVEPNKTVDIQYSQRDNQYYIRCLSGQQKVTIDFLIKIPEILSFPKQNDQNYHEQVNRLVNLTKTEKEQEVLNEINQMVQKFNKFGQKPLHTNENPHTGEDYLKEINEQTTGACRHRSVAFVEELKRKCPKETHPHIKSRIIMNDVHAKVEIQLSPEGRWFDCDLGGYPSKLNIQEQVHPFKKESNNLENNSPSLPIGENILLTPIVNAKEEEIKRVRGQFGRQLETWNKVKPSLVNAKAYCQHVTAVTDQKKRLVDVATEEELHLLSLQIQDYCRTIDRPYFYINSPDDLLCSAPFITRKGQQGVLNKGPGGSLYNFLKAKYDKDNPPILLINYANFSSDDLVRFNGLLDKERQADGTPLPQETLIVGLFNTNKPDCYQGEDFFSRFDTVETCPLKKEHFGNKLVQLPFVEESKEQQPYAVINLYHDSAWKTRLLGRWVLKKDNLYFEEGALTAAWAQGGMVQLENAPWDNAEFQQFWQQALIRGFIEHAGSRIVIPKDVQFIKKEGYAWDSLKKIIQSSNETYHQGAYVLNPGTFSLFFNQYLCNNQDHTLEMTPGLIEAHQGNNLSVHLTRNLSDDAWAALLTQCQQYQVNLRCSFAPGTSLPANLQVEQSQPKIQAVRKEWDQSLPPTLLIESTDIDVTLFALNQDKKFKTQVIDVSECESSELLMKMNGVFNEETLSFQFSQKKQAVLKALDEGQRVILTGSFSQEMSDDLAPLLLERQTNKDSKGQLILISNQMSTLSYITNVAQHTVTADDRKQALQEYSQQEPEEFINHLLSNKEAPLSQLKARLRYYRSHQSDNTDKAWEGLGTLSAVTQFPVFEPTKIKEKSNNFFQNRLQAVQNILKHSPFVYLSGLTAVGKSTFVEQYPAQVHNTTLYPEQDLQQWAKDYSEADKLIFIDEANIGQQHLSRFEGLFHTPPGILINGEYYPLTTKHKVIFAGNPLNYGGGRTLAPLFQRHGNALLFEAMPPEYIYEKILKPVFDNTVLAEKSLELAQIYLSVYEFLVRLSDKEVLISSRELQMMALKTLTYHQAYPQEDLLNVARFYSYELAQTLVPPAAYKDFQTLKLWEGLQPLTRKSSQVLHNPKSYTSTPSRQSLHHQLEDLFNLRTFKRKVATHEAQQYGGLGGLIIEGSPGQGKSELVFAMLKQYGYRKTHFNEIPQGDNFYYYMPVSMPPQEKEQLLLKAFDEGALVVVDEINSSPMMERLLNDLLMGKHPSKRPPKDKGFFLIGTQNPVTMAGRRLPGNALARRMTKVVLPDYSPEEMQSILIQQGIEKYLAYEMVEVFIEKCNHAKEKHLTPIPTFRDLLKGVHYYQRGQESLNKKEELIINNPLRNIHHQITEGEVNNKKPVISPEQFIHPEPHKTKPILQNGNKPTVLRKKPPAYSPPAPPTSLPNFFSLKPTKKQEPPTSSNNPTNVSNKSNE